VSPLVTRKVNIHEAKKEFSHLVDRAHAGEDIVLVKYGKPWARLVPLVPRPGRQPGLLRGLRLDLAFDEPLPQDELEAWDGRTDQKPGRR
jgi:prevent-host-death family protein